MAKHQSKPLVYIMISSHHQILVGGCNSGVHHIGLKCPYLIRFNIKMNSKMCCIGFSNFNVFDDQRHSDGVRGMCGNNSEIL